MPAEFLDELDAHYDDAGATNPDGGWRAAPIADGFRVVGWRIETPRGMAVAIDAVDWQWICDTTERWLAIVYAAHEARSEADENKSR